MRVLVATDGSDPADLAIDLVDGAAWGPGSEIFVVEAVESGAGLFGGPWPALAMVQADRIEADIRAQASRTVEAARARLVRSGLRVETAVLRGRPATAIVDRAGDLRADLIVVGSRGHGTIGSMLLGSTSAEVIDHAEIPVLVARRSGIGRVVLAWDGSPSATRAADLLRNWPILAGASVRVVGVADIEMPWWTGFPEPSMPEPTPSYLDAAEAARRHRDQLLHDMAGDLEAAGFRTEIDPRDGDAATQILAAAASADADLIVMGTHGRTGLARLVIGSVARNVVQHAACSVLVVRDRAGA